MFVPQKPHPMGNEYHSICCGLSGVMYAIEMVEGKDKPVERQNGTNQNHGRTVGLLLRLCKSIYGRGMVVILDSGFCVLKGLVMLWKVGVFASAVIKKRRYWPKYVPGAAMDEHCETLKVGECDCLHGELDNTTYSLFVMKDVDYNMKLMSTYGGLLEPDDAKERTRQLDDGTIATFKYMEPFYNHYKFRHAVDDHNNLRHSPISLEETWITRRWENRVFAFLLAITEVNMFLVHRYWIWEPNQQQTFLQFCRQLARALIHNEFMKSDTAVGPRKSKRGWTHEHNIVRAPPHAKNFVCGKWRCTAKDKYQKYTCRSVDCKSLIQTCCSCSPGVWMCNACHTRHVMNVGNGNHTL